MLPPDRAYCENDIGMKVRRVGALLAILEFLNVQTSTYEDILCLLRGSESMGTEFYELSVIDNPQFATQAYKFCFRQSEAFQLSSKPFKEISWYPSEESLKAMDMRKLRDEFFL